MNYERGEMIGRGGMANVYRGRHLGFGSPVAMKYLRERFSGDQYIEKRFLREAHICYRLNHPNIHPNIVRVLDLGRDNGHPYLVMELLEGETLRARLQRGPLPEAGAVAIARQILAALMHAHTYIDPDDDSVRYIVHRDIKPGNIFLCRDGVVKVTDFGIASVASSTLTNLGEQLGAAEYMSPEQVRGEQKVDARSDIYSLGILLYETLTGEVPFQSPDRMAVMRMQLTATPPPLPEWVSPRLRHIVMKALAKDPAARFGSAQEMLQALDSPPTPPPPPPPPMTWWERLLAAMRSVPLPMRFYWVVIGVAAVALIIYALAPIGNQNSKPPRPVPAPTMKSSAPFVEPTVEPTATPEPETISPPVLESAPTSPPPTPRPNRQQVAANENAWEAKMLLDQVNATIKHHTSKRIPWTSAEANRQRAKSARALRLAEKALHLDPKHRSAWLQRVRALRISDQRSAAQAALNRALTLFPGDPELLEQKQLMGP